MQLHLSSWPEIEQYLQTSQGIILPIGSTEQHSPMGLIGTDAICAEAIAKGVGEETNALIAPTINVGMALHHTAFAGTISLRPSTLIQVVIDYIICLAKNGFNRFYFLNGHGGNIATLKAAFSEAYYQLSLLNFPNASQVRCTVGNWFMCGSVYKMAKEFYGDQEGSHATPSEVAVTQFIYPEAIKKVPLSEAVGSGFPIYGAEDFRQHYPDGRMGSNPALATPEQGKQLYNAAVKELSEKYLKFLATS
jgi:creatinine amidohydrolase